MAKRKDPAASALAFFQEAPIEVAQTVLGLCGDVLKRRGGATPTGSRKTSPRGAGAARRGIPTDVPSGQQPS